MGFANNHLNIVLLLLLDVSYRIAAQGGWETETQNLSLVLRKAVRRFAQGASPSPALLPLLPLL